MNFGDRLRQERKKRGMSQADLADRSGVRLNMIEYFESPKSVRDPRLETVLRLAAGLGISASELIEGLKVDVPQPEIRGIISSSENRLSRR